MRSFYTVLMTARPNFLILSLSVVLLGAAISLYQEVTWSWPLFSLITIGAILAHAAVNMLNEYQDFNSGLDLITQRTPFSGGSGALVSDPSAVKMVKSAFVIVMLALCIIGVFLVAQGGWPVAFIGLIGIAMIVFYTQFITRMPWLCLIAPGLAFGPLMVIGTYYVLAGEVSELVVVLSLVPFFLVNNLLLLNQIPDLEADKKVGRYNILMHLGVENGIQIFAAFNSLAFIVLGVSIWLFELPSTAWLGMLALLIVFPMLRKVQTDYQDAEKMLPILGMNVIINLVTPVLIAGGLFISTVNWV